MIYAVVQGGAVLNRIELEADKEASFVKQSGLTVVADPENVSQIGGTYDGTNFIPVQEQEQ